MRSAQVKWKVHNKSELRLLLAQWDFMPGESTQVQVPGEST